MYQYEIFPKTGKSYYTFADFVEEKDGWLLFYVNGEHRPLLVQTCFGFHIESVRLITE